MSYDISHPADLLKAMKAHPQAFIKLGRREVTKHRTHGGSLHEGVDAYQLIHPGGWTDRYFCHSIDPKAVTNLEDSHELEEYGDGKWRLAERLRSPP